VRARCINACPAGVDTPAYLALASQGDFAKALAVHRERNPFALVCGRACPAFCEKKCRRSDIDEPVAVRLIKRYMADHEYKKPWTPAPLVDETARKRNAAKKVAIVGAGPAGLTAALRLAQMGYGVTVFEKFPTPGGMLSWAIPAYRLPRETLYAEIDNVRRAGAQIQCGKELGRDFTLDDLLDKQGFSAVILAIGAHRSRRLGIPGDDKPGVINGLDFLREVVPEFKGQRAFDVKGKRVGIVGGGDVAVDVARSALRLGASQVHVLYRRAGEHMPAAHLPEEIDGAMQEGIQFHTLVNPTEVLGDDRVTGVKVQRQRLTQFDASGRRKPVGIETETYLLHLDFLVPAVGQTPDLSCVADKSIQTTDSQTFIVGAAYNTTRSGVFAAGDAVTGPATIIQAVAHGNEVAVAVDEWLRTGQLNKPRFVTPRHDVAGHDLEPYANAKRAANPRRSVADRSSNFDEVELGLDEASARDEARRCLRCDLEWLDHIRKALEAKEPRQTAAPATPAAPEKQEVEVRS
jgi:NADH-quinone oxidoreductase subunit F